MSNAAASDRPKKAAKCSAVNPSPEYEVTSGGSSLEELREPVDVAERRGFEDVQARRPVS